MTIRLRGRQAVIDRLRTEMSRETRSEMQSDVNSLIRDLRAATPVETGEARDSWNATLVRRSANEFESVISNPVDYIEVLNRGTSTQAPARFVENAAARYFTQLRPLRGRR